MLATPGREIVETAIQLSMELPTSPALEVLDLAMRGHYGGYPDFSLSSHAHPAYANDLAVPSPFVELLRRAFDVQWDPREMMLLPCDIPRASSEEQQRYHTALKRHEALIQAFGTRYKLWGLGVVRTERDLLPRDLRLL